MSSLVLLGIIAVCLTFLNEADGQCSSFYTKVGGSGGGLFSEMSLSKYDIREIRMECSNFLTSIQVRYGGKWGKKRGWGSSSCTRWGWKQGTKTRILLGNYEYVNGAYITHDKYVNSITISTNKRSFRRCGTSTGKKNTFVNGRRLKYIGGRSGCIVDALYLYWPRWN